MSRIRDKSKLLKLLAETPVVSFACKKIGLDRTTYYRWYKDDKGFRDQVDHIMTIGRMNINDMAEASIIKEINSGNMRANIFWLQHNHATYRPVRTTYVEPARHYHELNPGEICRSCGYKEPSKTKSTGDRYMDSKKMAREIYKELRLAKSNKKTQEEIQEILDRVVEKSDLDDISEVRWIIEDNRKPKESDRNES